MILSQNRIEISVKGATSVLVGVKGLNSRKILSSLKEEFFSSLFDNIKVTFVIYIYIFNDKLCY